ncbi:MAG: tetratricopeptide repeat protein, partial [Deltaproteobacteria bacterium]|nr:tetratricopeptide repeat protein [Deltaproteobacteria bacterium]
ADASPAATSVDSARASDAGARGGPDASVGDPPGGDGGAPAEASQADEPDASPTDVIAAEAPAADSALGDIAPDAPDAPPALEGVPSGASAEELDRIAKHWVQQGNAELRGRQLGQARSSYERALRFNPRSRDARIGLGRVAFQQGQFADAVRYLEPVFRGRGNMELGIAYVRVGRPADAKAQFQKILERDPDNADAQRALRSLP